MPKKDQTAEESELAKRVETLEAQLEQQKKENQRFELVVESAPNGIIVANECGQVVLVNRQAEELFGYTRDEFLELSIEKLVPRRIRDTHHENRESFHKSPAIRQMGAGRDLYAMRKDGSEFPVEIGLTPLPSEDGMLVLSTIVDISERLQANERQKEINERFELVVESAPNGIIVANQDGQVVLVNKMAEQLFGYEREEFLKLSIEDLVPNRIRDTHHNNRHSFHNDPTIRQMGAGRDLYAMRKDGSEFAVEIGLTPLPGKKEMHVLSTIVDISERKQRTDDLKRYAQELERSNEELESFASVASHDLQEPLRKIRTMGDRLEKISKDELSDKGKDYLARMINASERMHHLILDLLTFSRVSTRTQPFALVDLNEPINDVISTLEIAIEESGGKVDVGDLPAAEVDESQIRQVFQNLIGNALKFAKPDTPPVVSVSGEIKDNTSVQITVKDNGVGFDQQYAERIFVIFQRLHGRSEYAGTGVGLAICKKIIERHGGTIEAVSNVGEGTEFHVVLPRKQKQMS